MGHSESLRFSNCSLLFAAGLLRKNIDNLLLQQVDPTY